jgi:hypothetical protein
METLYASTGDRLYSRSCRSARGDGHREIAEFRLQTADLAAWSLIATAEWPVGDQSGIQSEICNLKSAIGSKYCDNSAKQLVEN